MNDDGQRLLKRIKKSIKQKGIEIFHFFIKVLLDYSRPNLRSYLVKKNIKFAAK
jgi:hypothetical protein